MQRRKSAFIVEKNPLKVFQSTSPILWLDASDSSTFTETQSGTRWKDKSPSQNHFSGSVTSYNPSTGLYFNRENTNNLMTSQNTISLSAQLNFFIVAKNIKIDTDHIQTLIQFTKANENNDISIRYAGGILNGTPIQTGNTQDFANEQYYVNGTFNPSFELSVYSNYHIIHGVSRYPTNDNVLIKLSSTIDENRRRFTGYICEVIAYDSILSDYQRQQIERYLSQKWSIPIYSSLPEFKPPQTPVSKFINSIGSKTEDIVLKRQGTSSNPANTFTLFKLCKCTEPIILNPKVGVCTKCNKAQHLRLN